MIPVSQAQTTILEAIQPLPAQRVPLASAHGLVAAEEIAADRDSPPFDKSMMDGYAVVASDLELGKVELEVIEEVTAGQTPRQTVRPGLATRIMTGAPIPEGADAVVIVERSQ